MMDTMEDMPEVISDLLQKYFRSKGNEIENVKLITRSIYERMQADTVFKQTSFPFKFDKCMSEVDLMEQVEELALWIQSAGIRGEEGKKQDKELQQSWKAFKAMLRHLGTVTGHVKRGEFHEAKKAGVQARKLLSCVACDIAMEYTKTAQASHDQYVKSSEELFRAGKYAGAKSLCKKALEVSPESDSLKRLLRQVINAQRRRKRSGGATPAPRASDRVHKQTKFDWDSVIIGIICIVGFCIVGYLIVTHFWTFMGFLIVCGLLKLMIG